MDEQKQSSNIMDRTIAMLQSKADKMQREDKIASLKEKIKKFQEKLEEDKEEQIQELLARQVFEQEQQKDMQQQQMQQQQMQQPQQPNDWEAVAQQMGSGGPKYPMPLVR